MLQPLDTTVASVVFAARLLEKAVHDEGPWEISYGPHTVPAKRIEVDGGVCFIATLPEHCYLQVPAPFLTLLCAGEAVDCRAVDHPGDGETEIRWRITGAAVSATV